MRRRAAVALLLAACSPAPQPPAPGGFDAPAAVKRAEPGRPVQVNPDERFEVVLESNATTGYRWQLADSAMGGVVALVGSEYVPDPAPPGVNGSGGKERWTFRAVRPGETTVRMVYVRPWEAGGTPAGTDTFRVVVR